MKFPAREGLLIDHLKLIRPDADEAIAVVSSGMALIASLRG
jgi:hypothetical protein